MGRSRASSDRRGAAGFPGHSVTATLKLFQERGETSPEEAGKQGTFAVGGLLVDESGAEATNAVIRNGNLSDPTATRRPSGRRLACARTAPQALPFTSQLNNRQFARSMRECAGAILRSGMRVIIVAEDNFAGVHENLKPMPRELQVQAQKDMAFFGVQGKRLRPAHVAPIFASDVSAEHAARSTDIFSASVQEVQQKVGGEGSEVGPRIFEPTGSVFSNPARSRGAAWPSCQTRTICPTSMPSLSSSPWIPGAPQSRLATPRE
jgi:hypothetical protein